MDFCLISSKSLARCGIPARNDAIIHRDSDLLSGLGLPKTVPLGQGNSD